MDGGLCLSIAQKAALSKLTAFFQSALCLLKQLSRLYTSPKVFRCRKEKREPPAHHCQCDGYCGKYLYRFCYLVGNAFLELKRWRGIATLYKNTSSFLAAVHIRCIAIWAKIN